MSHLLTIVPNSTQSALYNITGGENIDNDASEINTCEDVFGRANPYLRGCWKQRSSYLTFQNKKIEHAMDLHCDRFQLYGDASGEYIRQPKRKRIKDIWAIVLVKTGERLSKVAFSMKEGSILTRKPS